MKKLLFGAMALTLFAARGAQGKPLAGAAQLANDYSILPNITYATVGTWEGKLDLYVTRTQGRPRPTLIYIHGGGWTEGSRQIVIGIPIYLAMGMNVVNVEYRLAEVAPAPAAIEDCRCALRWVFQHAKQYGIDLNRIVVAGASAGGHLALMTGILPASEGLDQQCPGPDNLKVSAIVNWYGVSDVSELLAGPNMQKWAVTWLGNAPERNRIAKRVSPLTYVRPGLPPVLTIHGDADVAVPYTQSVRLHKALTMAMVPNELMTIPGGYHGQRCWSETQRVNAYAKIRQFLIRHHVLDVEVDAR